MRMSQGRRPSKVDSKLQYFAKQNLDPQKSYFKSLDNSRITSPNNEHPWTMTYIIENCESKVMNAIRKQCDGINPKLKDDIHEIFKNLSVDLKNIKIDYNSNRSRNLKLQNDKSGDESTMSINFGQTKEELKLSNNILKIELEKMKFQLDGLMNSFNAGVNNYSTRSNNDLTMKYSTGSEKTIEPNSSLYKKLMSFQKCLCNLTTECEKMEEKIRNCKMTSDQRSVVPLVLSSQTSRLGGMSMDDPKCPLKLIQFVKKQRAMGDEVCDSNNVMLDKLCTESYILLKIMNALDQFKESENLSQKYKLEVEQQKQVIKNLINQIRAEKGSGQAIESNSPKRYMEKEDAHELFKTRNPERTIDLSKFQLKLLTTANNATAEINKEGRLLKEKVYAKVDRFSKIMNSFERKINDYESTKSKTIDRLNKEILQKERMMDEFKQYIEKMQNERDTMNSKNENLKRELFKLRKRIEVRNAKKGMEEIAYFADNGINKLRITLKSLINSKSEKLENIAIALRNITLFVNKQNRWNEDNVRNLKLNNGNLKEEVNTLRERLVSLNIELDRTCGKFKEETRISEDTRKELIREREDTVKLKEEITKLNENMKNTAYEKETLASVTMQLKDEKQALIDEKNNMSNNNFVLEEKLKKITEEKQNLENYGLELKDHIKRIIDEKAGFIYNQKILETKVKNLLDLNQYQVNLLELSKKIIISNNDALDSFYLSLDKEIVNRQMMIEDNKQTKLKLLRIFRCLTEQYPNWKQSIASKDNIIEQCKECIIRLNEELARGVAANKGLAQQLQEMTGKIDELKAQLSLEQINKKKIEANIDKTIDDKIREMNKQNAKKLDSLNLEIDTYKSSIEKLNQEIDKKQHNIELQNSTIEEFKAVHESKSRAQMILIEKLKNNIKKEEGIINEKNDEIQKLNNDIRVKAKEYKAQNNELNGMIREMSLKPKIKNTNQENLNDILESKDEEIDEHKNTIIKLKESLENNDEELKLQNNIIEKLNLTLARNDKDIKNYEEDAKTQKDIIDKLNKEIKSNEKKLKEQQNEFDKLTDEMSKLNKRVAAQTDIINELNKEIEAAKDVEKAHEDEIEILNTSIKKKDKEALSKNSATEKLNDKLKEHEDELQTQQKLIDDLKDEIKNNKETIGKQENDIKDLDNENKKHKESINKLKATIIEKEKIINEQNELRVHLEETIEKETKSKIDPIEVENSRKELIAAKNSLNKLQDENKELENTKLKLVHEKTQSNSLKNDLETELKTIKAFMSKRNDLRKEVSAKLAQFKEMFSHSQKLIIEKVNMEKSRDELCDNMTSTSLSKSNDIKKFLEEKELLEGNCNELKNNLKESNDKIISLERENKELQELLTTEREYYNKDIMEHKENSEISNKQINKYKKMLKIAYSTSKEICQRLSTVKCDLEASKLKLEMNIQNITKDIKEEIEKENKTKDDLIFEQSKIQKPVKTIEDESDSSMSTVKNGEDSPNEMYYNTEPYHDADTNAPVTKPNKNQWEAEYEEIKTRISSIVKAWGDKNVPGTIDEVERIIENMSADLNDAKKQKINAEEILKKEHEIQELKLESQKLKDQMIALNKSFEEKNKDVLLFITLDG